ncbi:MAG: alanine dehydrogenase [Pirellulaceae bacterium]|nr:alanine dehydrogenase [Pirellulaceae bacterium]
MIIGVPKEIKNNESRVGMLPAGVEQLTGAGHQVFIQKDAGIESGISDKDFIDQGAKILETADEIYGEAEMVVKVKEPLAQEYGLIREGQIVYTYFHFAASEELTNAMLASGATCVAYETLSSPDGSLPLLTPMSEVAGRLSVQEGAKFLERPQGGRGILLGGVPGVAPAHVTIVGGGVVGTNAAQIAAGFRANVTILDVNVDRLRYLDQIMPGNVTVLYSNRVNILSELQKADLFIGAVLIPGAKAPSLVKKEDLKLMKPGSVIVDVAVDQGGCVETTRATTHSDPVYDVDGVLHYCVANMPGAVGCTSTYALCNVTAPWALKIANLGIDEAMRKYQPIADAVNIHQGKVTNEAVAETFGLNCEPVGC